MIDIKQAADDAWLGIYTNEETLFNPLNNIPEVYRQEPHLYYSYLMSRPEYFSFICKEILNISIYPFQSVILNEVWNHQFPMLVASRGASKCVHYDTLVLSNKGIKKIGDLVNSEGKVYFDDLEVYSESGWQRVEYGWCNGVKETRIIELKNGMEIEATLNHPLRKVFKSKVEWIDTGDIQIGDQIQLLSPVNFNGTGNYSDEYVSSLAQLFTMKSNPLEVTRGFSRDSLNIYVKSLGFVNTNFQIISHFSKKVIKELQILAFWANGNKSESYFCETDNKYYLKIFNVKAFYSEVKTITKSRTKTYDLHLFKNHSFLSNGMVSHNSYTLALYALLRAVLLPGRKIIIVGSVFRQSKVIFNYISKMYYNSPLLRDSNPGKSPKMYPDRCELQIGDSLITALPIGNGGESIRGYRSNDTLADEFSSQSAEIFETVIAGFSSVSQDPVQNTKDAAALAFLKSINQPTDVVKRDDFNKDNQITITGSAYYYFNHFAQYWEKWKSIIHSKGDRERLNEIFKGDIPEGFNWEDYCVIRIPYQLLPIGFMSDANIARSKAIMTTGIFQMEFGACFSKDSNGFFKASSIENATANKDNNIKLPSSEEYIIFDAKVKGDPDKEYVFGVDPASEVDNFSVVIIELGIDHNRVVYCWTTNSKKFKKKLQKGLIDNRDYYGFCCRKIRNLMKDFNCVHVALDAQGGGKAVYEAFHDEKNMESGEVALWEVIESGKKKDSDGEAGKHVIQLAQFSNYEYISSANHNLKKDIEDKTLLFSRYSAALLSFEDAIAGIDEDDLEDTSIYDTLEDCIIELQELKTELAQIVVTTTASGRERWDTPETKISGSRKGRSRKDRYSALLIANASARKRMRGENDDKDMNSQYNKVNNKDMSYIGPRWATDALSELYAD